MHLAEDAWDDDLLAPVSTPQSSELRQRVWNETRSVLRWRRWRPPVVFAGVCGGCILAGVLIGRLSLPAASELPEARADHQDNQPVKVEGPRIVAATAQALESQAFDSFAPKERAARYFQAGHRYLEEENDAESALRCYRQGLDAAGGDDLEITPNDSWLLLALKNARHKEKINDQVLP
jgi:hypothetical protein